MSATSDPYDHPLIHDPYGTYGAKTLELLRRRWEEGPPASTHEADPELVVAKRDLDRARESLERARAEIAELRSDVGALTERAERAEDAAVHLRKLLRTVGSRGSQETTERDADPEAAFHILVVARWADSLTHDDRLSSPLRPYRLGPNLLASNDAVAGASVERVAWICAMIACGRAPAIDGLELHKLRTGHGGSDPQRSRGDGALAWRCAVKRNQPSAPRLHYWVTPDGVIEFADVVKHDDMGITP